jgi:hypothetical protein
MKPVVEDQFGKSRVDCRNRKVIADLEVLVGFNADGLCQPSQSVHLSPAAGSPRSLICIPGCYPPGDKEIGARSPVARPERLKQARQESEDR